MLDVLLWLDRFDLDGKQIATKRLRSLVENKRMPLRKVDRVDYRGKLHGSSHLNIFSEAEEFDDVELSIGELRKNGFEPSVRVLETTLLKGSSNGGPDRPAGLKRGSARRPEASPC